MPLDPEYTLRPRQVFFRLLYPLRRKKESVRVGLPWGARITVHPSENIGRTICNRGIYETLVAEAIARLLDCGETGVDVGANVGQMASLMARKVGPSGTVVCFEPCPAVFGDLAVNVARWNTEGSGAAIDARRIAVSDRDATATMHIPSWFDRNRGTATLVALPDSVEEEEVPTVRLDSAFPAQRIHLLKLDVEGFEAACLKGARDLLSARLIRDVIYEEFKQFPAPTHEILMSHGYSIIRIMRRASGPELRPCDELYPYSRKSWRRQGPPCYIATAEPERVRLRLSAPGWSVLTGL